MRIVKKAYISVFLCFVTKAINLELVSELISKAFLADFDFFVGRRDLLHKDRKCGHIMIRLLRERIIF